MAEISCDYTITVTSPDTSGNFIGYNQCEVDNNFLNQPVNDSQYDSETQMCMDFKSKPSPSYYEHYVLKYIKGGTSKNR